MRSLSYEATILLEKNIEQVFQEIGEQENKLSEIMRRNRHKRNDNALQINMVCNATLNAGLILFLATWLL